MSESRRFELTDVPGTLYRVSYGPDPLRLRPWETVTDENPLDGRWDDASRQYRVLYTANQRQGAYRESLQAFRPSGDVLAALSQIEQNDDSFEKIDYGAISGVVPTSWMATRYVGVLGLVNSAKCVDILKARSIDALRALIAQKSGDVRIAAEIDAGALLGAARPLTMQISRLIYVACPDVAGISAHSKLGAEHKCFSFFETAHRTDRVRADFAIADVRAVTVEDPDFVDVVNAFGLRIEGFGTDLAIERPRSSQEHSSEI